MDGICYVIKNEATGKHMTRPGQSSAPHLYTSPGKANAQLPRNGWKVVPVQLTELKEGVLQ